MPGPWSRMKAALASARSRAGGPDGPSSPRAERFLRILGPAFLAVAVLYQGILVYHEVHIGRYPVNDTPLHHHLSLRVVEAVANGENPLDCWVSAFSMGYPVWRTYQPLPHWITGSAMWALSPFADSMTVYALLLWVVVCLYPFAFYGAARLLRLSPAGAGTAALLCLATSTPGAMTRFGLGYGSILWRGSGVHTQLWALPLFALSLGLCYRALGDGRKLGRASLVTALTGLCHIIFGYAASVSAVLLALVPGRPQGEGAGWRRLFRLAWIGSGVLLLTAFLVLPAIHDAPWTNHSRWETEWKWDSFGAGAILGPLFRGELFDSGRAPVFSLLFLAGIAAALWRHRERAARALLGLAVLWLVLFLGRAAWGSLTLLFLVPENLHMHRFLGAFEVTAVLLVAFGADTFFRWPLLRRSLPCAAGASLLLAGALTPLMQDRGEFLRDNNQWGVEHRVAVEAEAGTTRALLDQLEARLREAPGRTFAGMKGTWGSEFRIGLAPLFILLAEHGIDSNSFLWHAMSVPSDTMVLMNEWDEGNLRQMGTRYVLAPLGRQVHPLLQEIGRHGRFVLYELDGGGYFGLVSVPVACTGDLEDLYRCGEAWLGSPMPGRGQVVEWRGRGSPDPDHEDPALLDRHRPAPQQMDGLPVPVGTLSDAWREGQVHGVTADLPEPGTVLFRMSYHPGWRATVDGRPVPLRMAVPGFPAIDVPAGRHEIRFEYRSGRGKTVLFLLGIIGFAGLLLAERSGYAGRLEERWVSWIVPARARLGERANRAGLSGLAPHLRPLLLVVFLVVLAMRPHFTGDLLSGHDAAGYPIRLAQFHENVRSGIFLPLWAPDLGAGHGQPTFAFSSPFLYWTAEIFHLAGFGLVVSINAALVLLAGVAALGMYLLGGRLCGREGGVLAAGAFLFSGYFLLDLYVRAAWLEFSGLCLMPWALLAFVRLFEKPGAGRLAAAAVAVALIALTHNAVLLMTAPALALVGFLHAAATRSFRPIAWGAGAGLWGMAMSAWFVVPTLAEMSAAHLDRLLARGMHFTNHFVWARQLFWSPFGYGLSVRGPGDGMPFQYGPALLAMGLVGMIALWTWRRDPTPWRRALGLSALLLALAGAFMSLEAARPLYDLLRSLQYAKYPWRFLGLSSLGLAVLAAGGACIWKRFERPRGGPPWGWTGTALSLLLLLAFQLPRGVPEETRRIDPSTLAPRYLAENNIQTLTWEEYEPVWVERPLPWTPERLEVVSGTATVRQGARTPVEQVFEVESEKESILQLNTFYFPGWRVRVDGSEVEVRYREHNGLMRFHVAPGSHTVTARLEHTPVRRASRAVSAAAILALPAVWVSIRLRRRSKMRTHG